MTMDKYIGKKLDGRYEITELIGIGGMAEVYKGVDVIDNKPVAIKILKKEYAENEEFLRRFRNESKGMAVLSHPNIVKIYDVGFSEKLQYIAMEYIDGITLKEYIEEEKVLTWKDTVHFIIQILRALQHAHGKGIVHRDIKPQNIMMFNDGTIKIMDFGIAKFAREEGKTATDQAIGSVHYISPEQASGSVTDEKSDIYSVGAMMYEMLTGKKPFDSDNPVAIAVMHMHDIPERPRAINEEIPDGLEEIVLRAMEKAPEDRYQSTGEMIADIEKFKADPSMVFGYYREEAVDDDEGTQYFNNGGSIELPPADEVPVAAGAAVVSAAERGAQPVPSRRAEPYGSAADYYDDDYDDEDEEEEEERSSLVVPVLTAVVVVVIIVGVIIISFLFTERFGDKSKQNNDWSMPDVVGMDFNEAVSKWGNNIQFVDDGQEFDEREPGVIIWQELEPGSEFKKGVKLKVKISKGMETVEIPDVFDKNAELAKDMITQLGLKVDVKNYSSTEVKKGRVVKTEPEAGQQANLGSTVILYVSIGEDLGQVSIDNWVGMNIEDATQFAEYQGLKVETVGVASYEEENKVVKQSIEPGEKVEKGTTIKFEYSNGDNPDGEIDFEYSFPVEANGRFVLAFMITNADNTVSTQETGTFYVPESASVKKTVVGSGENVNCVVLLMNMNNNKRATVGTYTINFAQKTKTCTSGGDIWSALEQVGGFPEPETEPPAPPEEYGPEEPNGEDYQPGINGDYVNGVWQYYQEGVNGTSSNGGWAWFLPGENGEWQNGYFVFYQEGVNGNWVTYDGGATYTWEWSTWQ